MPSLKRKKKTFTLIEVLIALAIATACAIFLLDYQQAHMSQYKESLHKLAQEKNLQEASVKFFEHLYTKQIDWQTIQDQKSYDFALDDQNFKAHCVFSLENSDTKESDDAMNVKATLSLLYKDEEVKNFETSLYFCCKHHEKK